MGLLVGGMTHDFNNMLTVILGASSVLKHQLSERSSEQELVREISDAACRASTLARRLLSVKPDEQSETVDMNQVVSGLKPLLARLLGDAITLVIRPDPRPCFVRADPAHLEQIVMNLAVNARDAMPNGGELLLQTACSAAHHPHDSSGLVELAVADSGIGMDHATQQRIFEPFYTTKGVAGTGLGLATVGGIVTRLGGHVSVDSEPGRGTRFKVLLPHAGCRAEPTRPC